MKILMIIAAMIMLPSSLSAEWNIEKPRQKIETALAGEIFGRPFIIGKATWGTNALEITSKDKVGLWPTSSLTIFIDKDIKDGKDEWMITPTTANFDSPHIHMNFGRAGADFPGTLTFTGEYCLYLKLVSKTEKIAKFKMHVSLPDYKRSYLLGEFTAKLKG